MWAISSIDNLVDPIAISRKVKVKQTVGRPVTRDVF
jgi:hypothetical protein